MSESNMNFFGKKKFIDQRRQPRPTDRGSYRTLLQWATTSNIATTIQIYSQCTQGSYRVPWAIQSMIATAID